MSLNELTNDDGGSNRICTDCASIVKIDWIFSTCIKQGHRR